MKLRGSSVIPPARQSHAEESLSRAHRSADLARAARAFGEFGAWSVPSRGPRSCASWCRLVARRAVGRLERSLAEAPVDRGMCVGDGVVFIHGHALGAEFASACPAK
jgi:hypothetical protein